MYFLLVHHNGYGKAKEAKSKVDKEQKLIDLSLDSLAST